VSGGSHGREEIFSVKKGNNITDVVTGKTLLAKIKKNNNNNLHHTH